MVILPEAVEREALAALWLWTWLAHVTFEHLSTGGWHLLWATLTAEPSWAWGRLQGHPLQESISGEES